MRANRRPLTTGLIALGILIAIPVSVAAQGLQSEASVASEQLGVTTLTVVLHVPYKSASLRVAGPEGYALTKGFDGGASITADLLADAKPVATENAPDGSVDTESSAARSMLPDGAYRYEAVFTATTGESRAHTGHFIVHNGNPTGLQATSGLLEPGSDSTGRVVSDPGFTAEKPVSSVSANFDVDDLVQILDANDNGTTHIFLQSGKTSTPPSNWHIRNDFGDIRFREFLGGEASQQNRLALVAGGNVGIGTTAPAARLHVVGSAILEGDVALGSSRTIKHEIEPLDAGEILEAVRHLPLYSWKYLEDASQAGHVGPMAEDVYATFRLGRDEKHLSPSDSAGLALAAVQGVDRRLDRELRDLRRLLETVASAHRTLASENASLRERLAEIERSVPAGDPGGME